ncbi:hypothetical protein FOZ62_024670 [Perkinsus olseni]|uniref:Uncharacterized protein n=1 Tax=Perkinsus olseni TaxID=32597 RepID=A0A7J6PTU1_PEROL|nr:hypothetical protein FOZ62_024670 [Perkinsus olseni]
MTEVAVHNVESLHRRSPWVRRGVPAVPSWLDDPPQDFLHLPAGADNYAKFSLSLLLKNNPSWLRVELLEVKIFISKEDLVCLSFDDPPASKEGTISIVEKVPLTAVTEGAYLCLRYAPGMVRTLTLDFTLEARFTLFGRKSDTFELSTNLTYDLSQQGNYTEDHKLGPRGEWIAQICREHIYEEALPTAEHHTGKIVVLASDYESSSTSIRLGSLYDADLI